jgi:hypothetical protein
MGIFKNAMLDGNRMADTEVATGLVGNTIVVRHATNGDSILSSLVMAVSIPLSCLKVRISYSAFRYDAVGIVGK